MKSSKCLKSFWASWQVSYTVKWEAGRRPDCLTVTWESEEVNKPKSLQGSKEHSFFLKQQEETIGQSLLLCNFIGWFHCFFHVVPKGESVLLSMGELPLESYYRGWERSLWEINEWCHIESPTELSDKCFGNCAPKRPLFWGQEVLVTKH